MQDHAANKLNVKGAQAQYAAGGFPHYLQGGNVRRQ